MFRTSLLLLLAACAQDPMNGGTALDGAISDETFASLPSDRLAPPGVPVLCKPPKAVPGNPVSFTVSDANPGEIVTFVRGIGTGGRPICPPSLGGECTTLINPTMIGRATADASGVATLTRILPANIAVGYPLIVQAAIRRGVAGADSVLSNITEELVVGSFADVGHCDDLDACTNLPDGDNDGVSNVCDICPSFDDNIDADGDGVPDQCDRLNVTPSAVTLNADVGESVVTTVTVENATGMDVDYVVSDACGFVTANTGGANPSVGTAPAGGGSQIAVTANAAGLAVGVYTCEVVINATAPVPGRVGSVDLTLEVTPPGVDISLPPDDTTTPTGIDAPVQVTVTDENNNPLPGYVVTFEINNPTDGVVFDQNGGTTYDTVTDAYGNAVATLDTPDGYEGEVTVDVEVYDPTGTVLLDESTVTRSWQRLEGSIFYWDIGGGGNIMKMPADFSVAPTLFDGSSVDGQCSGCHTASPGPIPTTGFAAVMVQNRATFVEEILRTDTGAVVRSFPGDSSDNDFSPDSRFVAWSTGDLQIYNVVSGVNNLVTNAADPGVAEVFPTFSSDGSHLAYTACVGCSYEHSSIQLSILGGVSSIRTVPIAGGPSVELVAAEPGYALYYPEFSPDGRWLVYNRSWTQQWGGGGASSYSSSTAELWILPVNPAGGMATGPARRLNTANGPTGAANSWATWAPDSSFVAFASNRLGNWDLFVSAISGSGTDSPAVTLPYASGPNGQHIPAWGP